MSIFGTHLNHIAGVTGDETMAVKTMDIYKFIKYAK
jgi:hypothetical protein